MYAILKIYTTPKMLIYHKDTKQLALTTIATMENTARKKKSPEERTSPAAFRVFSCLRVFFMSPLSSI